MADAPEDPDLLRTSVGWGDLDGNNHFANTAILNRAADARLRYFARRGFSGARFATERFGPVVVRDELVYRKELRLLDSYSVDVRLSGISADGTWIGLENTFRNAEGEVTAIVRSDGVWFDLDRRRPRAPPPDLHELLQGMPRSPNFRALPDRGPHGPAEPPGTSAGTSR